MRLIARIASLWRTWRHRDRLEAELDEELRGYLDARVARRIAAGERPERARRAELVEIGSVESLKARVREVRMGRLLEETVCDIRHAARGFRHAPGFTLTVLATLAIGVAANTAIFSVAYALLVQPLPFRDPDRLVFVWADQTSEGYPRAPLSGPELRDLDERSTAFDGFAAIWATTTSLTGETEPEQLRIGLVTSDYFSRWKRYPTTSVTGRRR